MNVSTISEMAPSDTMLINIGSDIWLMDNHRWALIAWDNACKARNSEKSCLIHADYHWDGVNDFHDEPELELKLANMNSSDLFELVQSDNFIRYDSFIAPAIIRGLISEVHFFCKQDDISDKGTDVDLLRRFNATQYIHPSPEAIANIETSSAIIFDLCLDLFNKSEKYYSSEIWPDTEILEFLTTMQPIIRRAHIVTVSLSFGFSGTESDTRRLAQLVLPELKRMRQAS